MGHPPYLPYSYRNAEMALANWPMKGHHSDTTIPPLGALKGLSELQPENTH